MKKVKSLLLQVTVLVAQVLVVLVLVEAEEVTEVEGCAAASSALAHIVDKSFIQMLGTTDEQEEYYS